MLKRFAPLVPIALTVFLAACAGHAPQTQPQQPISDAAVEPVTRLMIEQDEPADDEINALIDDQPYEMPQLADSLLDLGRSLIGCNGWAAVWWMRAYCLMTCNAPAQRWAPWARSI